MNYFLGINICMILIYSQMFELAGFAKIKQRNFKEGDIPDIQMLDNRPGRCLLKL